MKNIFREEFEEQFIVDLINESIKTTLVISNPQSLKLVTEKIKQKLQSEFDKKVEKLLKEDSDKNKGFYHSERVSNLLRWRCLFIIPGKTKDEDEHDVASLYVNCNDLFMWGCADCEPISKSEIDEYYKMVLNPKYKGFGSDIWCCIKRNEQPQEPVRKMMKDSGAWDETMEKLDINAYDGKDEE